MSTDKTTVAVPIYIVLRMRKVLELSFEGNECAPWFDAAYEFVVAFDALLPPDLRSNWKIDDTEAADEVTAKFSRGVLGEGWRDV